MLADARATYIARSSEVLVFTVQDKQVIVFLGEGFQLPAPSQCQEMIEITNVF